MKPLEHSRTWLQPSHHSLIHSSILHARSFGDSLGDRQGSHPHRLSKWHVLATHSANIALAAPYKPLHAQQCWTTGCGQSYKNKENRTTPFKELRFQEQHDVIVGLGRGLTKVFKPRKKLKPLAFLVTGMLIEDSGPSWSRGSL